MDGESMFYIFLCVQSYPFCIFSRFPRRTTPVSTGCSAGRDSTRVMLFFFIFWRADVRGRFGRCLLNGFCPNRGDVCGKYFAYLLSVAVLTVRRGRMHIFLSSTVRSSSDSTDCAATLLTAAMFGKGHVTDQFPIDGAGRVTFIWCGRESRSGICDEDSIRVHQGSTS